MTDICESRDSRADLSYPINRSNKVMLCPHWPTCSMAGVRAGTDHPASAAQGRQAGSSAASRNCSSSVAGGAGGKLLPSFVDVDK